MKLIEIPKAGSASSLFTLGKVYEILRTDGECYVIKNDADEECFVLKTRFSKE